MSHYLTVHAIKIKIVPEISSLVGMSNLDDYGIYINGDDTQEIRVSEVAVAGLSELWTTGIIAQIGDRTKKISKGENGAVEEYSGLTVTFVNNNQLILRYKELGININGLRAELHEFIGTEADSDASSRDVIFTGTCAYEAASKWDENYWNVEIKNERMQRNAFVGTLISNDPVNGNFKDATDDMNGKTPPITIGKFQMFDGIPYPAKFIRTGGKQTVISNAYDSSNYYTPYGTNIFPIVGFSASYSGEPALGYRVLMGFGYSGNPLLLYPTLVGKWIKIIEGSSTDGSLSLVGKYRRITATGNPRILSGYGYTIDITIDSYFEQGPDFNDTVSATYQTWIQILNIPFVFSPDTWPCAGFLDDAEPGVVSSEALNIFSYKSNNSFLERKSYDVDSDNKLIITSSFAPIGFRKIASYGYEALSSSGNITLIINAILFNGDTSQMLSWDIFPLKNLAKYCDTTLGKWGLTSRIQVGSSNLYGENDTGFPFTIDTNSDVSGTNWCDKSAATYLDLQIEVHKDGYYMHDLWAAYEADIPIEKILFEYDSYYLGISMWSRSGDGASVYDASQVRFMMRRFVGALIETLPLAKSELYVDDNDGGGINNLPDFYYDSSTNNGNFFLVKSNSDWTSSPDNIYGHEIFKMNGIDSIDKLKAIYKIGFVFGTLKAANGYSIFKKYIHLNELAIICKMSVPIGNELYSLFAGRTFEDTWGSRKTAANLITNTVDVLEHFKRLQCGIEFGDTVEFGKAYSPGMLIKTGSGVEGSYDNAILDTVKTYSPAFQIHDTSKAYTDSICKEICRQFGLCTYTDIDGYECVTTIDAINPTETITFADIVTGSIGETKEPDLQDIYCQPIFKYRLNQGSGNFDQLMAVTNIQAASYDPSYTPGIDNTAHNLDVTTHDGEYIWNQCKANFNKYRHIEPCPSSFSDHDMVVLYADAVKIFSAKISRMGRKRNTCSVFYSKGKDYFAGKHIKIKLPFQTVNLSVEILLETVKICKRSIESGGSANRVDLSFVLLSDISTPFFFE
jgi:hypothetical protein